MDLSKISTAQAVAFLLGVALVAIVQPHYNGRIFLADFVLGCCRQRCCYTCQVYTRQTHHEI
jgi:hypothetical protein